MTRLSSGRQTLFYTAALIAVAAGFIAWFPKPSHAVFWDRAYNIGHLVVFGLLTLGLFRALEPVFPPEHTRRRALLAAAIGVLAGILLEAQQLLTSRDADVADGVRNVLGALCAGAWLLRRPGRLNLGLLVIGSLGLIAAALPLISAASFYEKRAAQLPVLFAPMDLWNTPQLSKRNLKVKREPGCMRITKLEAAESSVFRILDIWPDWSGSAALVLEVQNPGTEAFPLTVWVADNYDTDTPGNWGEKIYPVPPGEHALRWPLDTPVTLANGTRANRLDRMRYVQLFTPANSGLPEFCLREVRLE